MTEEILLRDAPVGARVTVAGFGREISAIQLEQLMSYGLVEGHVVDVLAQRPVTVVLVEHTELALESAVAAAVRVRAG